MRPAETARRQAGAALVEALDVLSAALPRAVELARTEERAAERAAVVAWLEKAGWMPSMVEVFKRGEHRREEAK
jgi:predicted Zn-dependent protease